MRYEGGWYFDYGLVPNFRLEGFEESVAVFRRAKKYPGRIVNGALFSKEPGNPFFDKCINSVLRNYKEQRHQYSLPHFAGTRVLTSEFCKQYENIETMEYERFFKSDLIINEKHKWIGVGRAHTWPELQKTGVVNYAE